MTLLLKLYGESSSEITGSLEIDKNSIILKCLKINEEYPSDSLYQNPLYTLIDGILRNDEFESFLDEDNEFQVTYYFKYELDKNRIQTILSQLKTEVFDHLISDNCLKELNDQVNNYFAPAKLHRSQSSDLRSNSLYRKKMPSFLNVKETKAIPVPRLTIKVSPPTPRYSSSAPNESEKDNKKLSPGRKF